MAPTNTTTYSVAWRKLSLPISRLGADLIADSAHGLDQFDGKAPVDLGAYAAEVGFHDVGTRLEAEAPDPFLQHPAGDGAAGVLHQKLQQPE